MAIEDEKNWISSENEDLPSNPEPSDFPVDEWITESLNFDFPTGTQDITPPQIESNYGSDTIEKGE